jgi:hypothetical protein
MERETQLAARFAARIWDSPLGDLLHGLFSPATADAIATELIVGLLKDVLADD